VSPSSARECDVFLSYAREDWPQVEPVARRLSESGLDVFIDLWYVAPGKPWQVVLENALSSCRAVAVFIGPGGLTGWQRRESEFSLDQQRTTGLPVIPVLLPRSEPVSGFLRLNSWVDMRGGIDDPIAFDALIAGIDGRAPGPPAEEQIRNVRGEISPYRGLASFREEDAPFFFGREVFVDRLAEAVETNSMVAVVGPSGGGKSSVVRAGLIPRLRRADSTHASEIVVMVPGAHPVERLAQALLPLLEPQLGEVKRLAQVSELATLLTAEALSLRTVVSRVLEKQPGTSRFVLVVDQWEELYTLASSHDCDLFVRQLLGSADGRQLSVVLTMRGSFYGEALRMRALADRLQGAVVNLSTMSPDEVRSAVVKPAELAGLEFESGLVDRILGDVGGEPGNLPLLEFLLFELWQSRRGSMLLHSVYDEIGGVQGAIANRANRTMARMKADEPRVRQIFSRLVQTGVYIEDTRRRIRMDDLPETDRKLVRILADERLLVTRFEQTTQVETVEVAHEALIRHWDRLGQWLAGDREFLLWRERLRSEVDDWRTADEDADALLRGRQLVEAEGWLADRADDLNEGEIDFIKRSTANRENEERTRKHDELVASARAAAIFPSRAFIGLAILSVLTLSLFVPAREGWLIWTGEYWSDWPTVAYWLAQIGRFATLYTPVVVVAALYSFSVWVDRAEDVYEIDAARGPWYRIRTAVLPFRRVARLWELTGRLQTSAHERLRLFLWRLLWPIALILGVVEDLWWWGTVGRDWEPIWWTGVFVARTITVIVVVALTLHLIKVTSSFAPPNELSKTPGTANNAKADSRPEGVGRDPVSTAGR